MALKEKTEFGTARQMITEDKDFSLPDSERLLKIDLACGKNKKEGFKGVDKENVEGVDIVHNLLTFPWPFEDASIYEMNCEHFIEHIPAELDVMHMGIPGVMGDGLGRFMEEVYRCLMMDGTIRLVTPYYTSVRAWQDPTHRRAITDLTYYYFSKELLQQVGLDHYMPTVNFEILSRTYILNPEWEFKSEQAKRFAMRHYWNVVDDLVVILRKKSL